MILNLARAARSPYVEVMDSHRAKHICEGFHPPECIQQCLYEVKHQCFRGGGGADVMKSVRRADVLARHLEFPFLICKNYFRSTAWIKQWTSCYQLLQTKWKAYHYTFFLHTYYRKFLLLKIKKIIFRRENSKDSHLAEIAKLYIIS